MQNAQQPQRAAAPARRPKPEIPEEFKAEPIEKLDQAALIKILEEPGSEPVTVFRKGIACKRLGVIGTKESVPAIAALLGDDRVSDYARDALEAQPDAAADDALRAALSKQKGLLLVGVINSVRRRRDAKALDALGRLLYSTDAMVARASAMAVGEISGPAASKMLHRALSTTKGANRADVAAGALLCADRLMETERAGAMALLDILSRPDIPGTVRVSAMHQQVLAETAIKRPRPAPAPLPR